MVSYYEHFIWSLSQRLWKVKTQTLQKYQNKKRYYASIASNETLPFLNGIFAENPKYKVKDRLKHAACWSNASARTDGILKQSICDHSIIKIKVAYSPAEVLSAACQFMSKFLALLFQHFTPFFFNLSISHHFSNRKSLYKKIKIQKRISIAIVFLL